VLFLRKSNKNGSIRKGLFSASSNKRVSICGDGMTKDQLRIDETILMKVKMSLISKMVEFIVYIEFI